MSIYFLGKLAAANRKEAAEAVRRAGEKVAQKLTPEVHLVVVGEGDILARDWNLWNDQLDAETREAFEAGSLEIVSEMFFWEKYGGEHLQTFHRTPKPLYTPTMLAELADLPISVIRQLQKRQLIVPVRQVHKLSYFDAESILPLKIIRSMLHAGLTLDAATDRLRKISRHFSQHFPAGLVNVHVEGKEVFLMTTGGLVDHNGQRQLPFEAVEKGKECQPPSLAVLESVFNMETLPNDPETLCDAAWKLESEGNLQGAADLYRAALASGGGNPVINFQLAEILYRLGDLPAARERYFTAIELDETFVEARANLGCVLAEQGRDDLAAAAFRGALRFHPDYAEVRFHLGMLLKRTGQEDEAEEHLRIFRELMPDSPWCN
ncbi:O-linked GlcNAc transferase [Planctomycetales bacterium]|nr:O-linked GlcNAc transferase [Planctomycetales bacterium]